MDGVTITGQIFEGEDVNGDGTDDLLIGADFDNSNSREAELQLAYEIQFDDGTTVSDRNGKYTAPPGESPFEGEIRLTSDGGLFTELQVQAIKNGDYEYQIWIVDVSGISSGSDDGTTSGPAECDPAVIADDSTDTVRWEGIANGTFEIESVDLTITNIADFPVAVDGVVLFFGEGGATDVESTVTVSAVLEAGESRDFKITRTGIEAKDWSVELDVSCP